MMENASQTLRVLSPEQRKCYLTDGYLLVDRLIDGDIIAGLNTVTDEFVARSRQQTKSDKNFDLAPEHSADAPMVRRIKRPDEQHPLYWDVAVGVIADVVADLLGPDVVYHHSKLNFKWHGTGDGSEDTVAWHQDIQFYPHTNYSPLTVGIYLRDTGPEDGPLTVLPGSHDGAMYDQYDGEGNWTGCLSPTDSEALDISKAVELCGLAGSITIHNCRTVHSSPPSKRANGRPLLLHAYAAGDAFAYTAHPDPSCHAYEMVRGTRARWARHDPRPCLLPPDWSGGYTSIYAAQTGEGAVPVAD
ncbi:MAG: phytanoyl-CoA dioxygenase family protein [Rhodospirillaceae bacterium]|nr:phytanoyl-CoA dioxygenase family protein [Rhodospirillaceae bacterium]MBT6536614.1 phytanoyl-CoA dioxygenase family protein [Rhodospirillaceae bacterium]